MKRFPENNEIIVDKINLNDFVATLMELHELGIEYIDLAITKEKDQDQIRIVVRHEHNRPKRLTDKDINQLLK